MNRQPEERANPNRRRSIDRERLVDEILVLRAREGSEEALGMLTRRWHERLARHAVLRTGDAESARDVLQDSWIAMARGIGSLRDPAAFRQWAFTIVERAATTRLRRRSRDPVARAEVLDELPAPEDVSGDRAAAVLSLRCALRTLNEEDRVLVSLHYLEGLDLREVSGVLNHPVGTLKSRLHRIRHQLRQVLEKERS